MFRQPENEHDEEEESARVLTSGGGSSSHELPVSLVGVSHRTPLLVPITRVHTERSSSAIRLHSECIMDFRQSHEK